MLITLNQIRDFAAPKIIRRGKEYFLQKKVFIQQATETEIFAKVHGSRWYEVELYQDDNVFDCSCTCPYDWDDACKHIVAVMFAAMESNGTRVGANIIPWPHLAAVKAPKQKPPKTPSWKKDLMALLPSQATVAAPSFQTQKPWRLAYSLRVSGPERELVPVRVKQLKGGGDATPTVLKQFDLHDGVHFDLTDRLIVSRIQHSFRNYVSEERIDSSNAYYDDDDDYHSPYASRGYYSPWESPRHDWNDVLLLLAGKELYLESGENLLGKSICVSSEPARWRVSVSETDGGIVLQPELERNGSVTPLGSDVVVIISDPLWILLGGELFKVHGVRYAELQAFKQKRMRVLVPSAGRETFLNTIMPQILSRYEVRSELHNMRTVRADPVPRIYLTETEGALTVELRFAYADVEVACTPPPVVPRLLTTEAQLVQVGIESVHLTRKCDLEATFQANLLDFSLKQMMDDDSRLLYVPAIPPLDWVLTMIPKLQEAGFFVFGQDELQAHKLRREAPIMRFAISSGIDWFDMSVDVKFSGTDASLDAFVKAVVNKSRYVRLGDGSYGVLPQEWMDRFSQTLAMFELSEDTLRFSRAHVSMVDTLLESAEEVNCDEAFHELRKKFQSFKNIEPVAAPTGFTGELRPYQKAGYDWLHFLRAFGVGGILADDMGLGKTVQALALLQHCYENGESLPSLIVVPSSPLFNWKKEAERFTPSLRVLVYSGTERHSHVDALDSYNVILTSYGILRRDIEALRQREFLYVVLDESQNIKNHDSVNAKAARLLRARHKLALTGTPVENNLMELWSQFCFLNPGMLGGERAFATHFSKPIEKHKSETASHSLKRIVFPFILRRTKETVASELPPKVETVTYCDMDPAQRSTYDHWREYYRRAILRSIESVGFARSKMKVLEGLMKLRQVCCHPSLVDAKYSGSSGKFEAFMEMIDDILAEGHKVLVFSQFVRMLKVLRRELDGKGIAYEYLDGHTRDRAICVDRFQNDENRKLFLISLKAGGTGLNLTAADYVIHYDPWWNPAVEMQATDRAHRIGQTKHVFAYKLITRDTVEEKVLALQEKKKELVKSIISTDSGFVKSLTKNDVEMLFR
ncbi:MAG: SNF2 helicase associated domain-containing protein [Ignavibacteriae bacterium]|nr:SNF2 helicase associated domain-containing protein [Ignavibacteriota bacterium]